MKKHNVFLLLLFTIAAAALPYKAKTQCCPLYADFKWTINGDGYTATFTNESAGESISSAWTFGDGATSTAENPVHTYPGDGDYVVRLKVTDACNVQITKEKVIHIVGGSPTSLWLSFEGPTLVANCQKVIFSANTVGGVPPYVYTWSMGDDYCAPDCALGNCSGPNEFTTSDPTIEASFTTLDDYSFNNVCVTVTDANGSTDEGCIPVKVKSLVYLPEINVIAEKSCGGDYYGLGTQVLFTPDIDPLNAFEYPTDYFWDYGDGSTYLDNFDGGGYGIHTYTYQSGVTYPKKYTVKLTITDPYGSMQVTKDIWVCDPNNSGGNNNCALAIQSSPDAKTVSMDYSNSGGVKTFYLVNEPPFQCFPTPVQYKWTLNMTNCGLANPIINQATHVLGLYIGPSFELNLPSTWWNEITGGLKPWGCVSLQVNRVDNNNNGCSDGCPYAFNPCIAYVKPDELIISDVEVSGSCQDFELTAQVSGGGWKLDEPYLYKEYSWKAFDSKNPDQEIDILDDVFSPPGSNNLVKNKKKVDLDHPYFEQFGPTQVPEFMLRLTVTDFANNIVESNKLVQIDPFRLHLKENYNRCPGVASTFSDQPLVTGGSGGPYTYSWWPVSPMHPENPVFTAPQSGQATYSVTVTDDHGCSLSQTTTITATPLLPLNLLPFDRTCASGPGKAIGPNTSNLGGSGSYTYQWSPTTYLSNPNVRNPLVQNMPAGQSQVYTLTITDKFGGCTVSGTTTVISYFNNLFVDIAGPTSVCYGKAITLEAQGLVDPKTSFSWTTTNPHIPLPLPTSSVLNLSELTNSYPGTYNYKVRLTNNGTGCFVEDDVNVVVGNNWEHKGYVSTIKTAIAGSSVPVWQAYSDNRITSGVDVTSSLASVTSTWAPLPVTDIENNGGNIHALIPKNAKFIPTVQNPFTVMTVTDNQTTCTNDYKSIRYLIVDAKPDIWVSTDKPSICTGDEVCFNIVFDLHLSNYATSLLPPTVKAHYTFKPPFPNTGNQPQKTGDIELHLVNQLGLYKATLCESDYFQYEALEGGSHRPYFFGVSVSSNTITFDLYDIEDSASSIWINVRQSASWPALSTCTFPSGYFYTIDLGLNPCQYGTTMYSGYIRQLVAGKYIELHPDAGIEIYAISPAGEGHHLFINECITPQFAPPVSEESNSLVAPNNPGAVEGVMLDVYPNPFSGRVNIRYNVEGDNNVNATLNLLDFTGKLIQVIRKENEISPGYYEMEYDGGSLPPGVYLYQLIIEDKGQITKKAVKIGF